MNLDLYRMLDPGSAGWATISVSVRPDRAVQVSPERRNSEGDPRKGSARWAHSECSRPGRPRLHDSAAGALLIAARTESADDERNALHAHGP